MIRRCGVIIVVVLFVSIVSLSLAGDWYVDNQATAGLKNGSDWANAFTNLESAVSTVWGGGANSGDTIYIRQADAAPNYSEQFIIGAGYADGTASAYNRIMGWTDTGYKSQPVIEEQGSATIIQLGDTGVSRNFYEFNNLEFKGGSYYYYGLRLYDASSNIRCMSNYFSRISFSSDDALNIANTNIVFQGNTVTHGHIRFRYDEFVYILDNDISEIDPSRTVITMNIKNFDFFIKDNILKSGDCIASQSGERIIVSGNRMEGSYRACIWVDNYPNDWEIYNNVFHDTTGAHSGYPNGIGIILSRGDHKIYNNTFNNFPETGANAIRLVNLSANTTVVFNNIISGVSTGIVSVGVSGSTTNDYNNFWNVGSAYEGNASAGANDKALDPDFVDTNTFDFALQNELLMDSAADSFAGVDAPTVDYNGDARTAGKIAFGAVDSDVPQKGTVVIVN